MSHQKALLTGLFVFAIVLGSYYVYGQAAQETALDLTRIEISHLPESPSTREAVQVFQDKVKQNPLDAASYTILGQLFLQQARLTGDAASYEKAERALQTSLSLVPQNTLTETSLAATYYAQHRFSEALELAELVLARDPANTQAQATLGDAHLALGNYPEAELAYQQLAQASTAPAVLARLAHLAELQGETAQALALLQRAAEGAVNQGQPKDEIAWYLIRLGDLHFNAGELNRAEKYYRAAQNLSEDYYLARASLGKLSAARGHYEAAIAYYQQSVEIIPQPDFLAALGDLYWLTGQPEKAEQQYQLVEFVGRLAALNAQLYNRQMAYFYADHQRHLEEALHLAASELEVRQDIYGYDAAAWASFQNGLLEQAEIWMAEAMKLGTRDAKLYYHAGMIALAQGKTTEARAFFAQVYALNPYFDPLQMTILEDTLKDHPEAAP